MQLPDAYKDKSKPPRTIVIFGAAKTGKSCVIKQFLNQTYEREYHATIEDVYNRKFEVNGQFLDLQFIDTGGFYNFPAMRKLCIKKAAGFILVFSVIEQESLYYLTEVLDQINSIHSTELENEDRYTKHIPIVVLGNKGDLINKRCVHDEEVHEWLKESYLVLDQYILTSAKEEDGIWDAFSSLYFQFKKQCLNFDGIEHKQGMASNIRRLSAFASLAISPSQQIKTFFGNQISSELTGCSSTTSSFSSSSGASPHFSLESSTAIVSTSCSKIKRNSRPSLAKLMKDNSKYGRIKEPIKLDCVIS